MSNHNFESQPEGDWEDRGDISWNEVDWQHFLLRQDKEVARFLRFYDESTISGPERLDVVARQMGWDSDDWSVSDFPEDDDLDSEEDWSERAEENVSDPDFDPYTLHRHPVYVVSTGLILKTRYIWRNVLEVRSQEIGNVHSWDFSESLSEAEKHILMSLQSMEVGDYLLCVVHLKRTLRGINLGMNLLNRIHQDAAVPLAFLDNLMMRLFDLREVCLRVMKDCRDEENRGFSDLDS